MRCSYCFYIDEMAHRNVPLRGAMSQKTAQFLIDKALEYADGECTFAFQGGEPTLAGLPFFQAFSEYVGKKTLRDACGSSTRCKRTDSP